jgi:hypothetical protein
MATLFCECGYKLWSEFWWGGSKHAWVFLDDEKTSDTYAKQVTRCPECGGQVTNDRRGAGGQDLGALQTR